MHQYYLEIAILELKLLANFHLVNLFKCLFEVYALQTSVKTLILIVYLIEAQIIINEPFEIKVAKIHSYLKSHSIDHFQAISN